MLGIKQTEKQGGIKKSCDRIVWTQHIDWIAEKFCNPLVSESYRKKSRMSFCA